MRKMTRGNSMKYIGLGIALLGLIYSMYLYSNLRTNLEDTSDQLSQARQQKKEISDQLAVLKEHLDRLEIQHAEVGNKLLQMEILKNEESSRTEKLASSLTLKETELKEAQTDLGRIRKEHEVLGQVCEERLAKQQSEFESLQKAKQTADGECQNSKRMDLQKVRSLRELNEKLSDTINSMKQSSNNQPINPIANFVELGARENQPAANIPNAQPVVRDVFNQPQQQAQQQPQQQFEQQQQVIQQQPQQAIQQQPQQQVIQQQPQQQIIQQQPQQQVIQQQPQQQAIQQQPQQQAIQQFEQQQHPQMLQQQPAQNGIQFTESNQVLINASMPTINVQNKINNAPAVTVGNQRYGVLANIIGDANAAKLQDNGVAANQILPSNKHKNQLVQGVQDVQGSQGVQGVGEPIGGDRVINQPYVANSQENGNDAPLGEEMADGALVADENRLDNAQRVNGNL